MQMLDGLLTELELSTDRLELSHDTFSRNTHNQLRQVFDPLRELADKVNPPEPPPAKRPIGFLPLDSNSDKPKNSTKAAKAVKVGPRKRT